MTTLTRNALCVLLPLAFMPVASIAQEGVTILQPHRAVLMDFGRLRLAPDAYGPEQLTDISGRTRIELIESIDASMLVVFGEQTPPEVFAGIFEAQEIAEALDRLLRRGGAIYFGPLSWDIFRKLPNSMRSFFAEREIFLPGPDNYVGAREQPGKSYRAYAARGLVDHPLVSHPHSLAQADWMDGAHAVNHWAHLPESIVPLLAEPNGANRISVFMQEGVLGDGKVIWSLAYSLTRTGRSPFFINLTSMLYRINPTGSQAQKPVPARLPDHVLYVTPANDEDFTLDGRLNDRVWRRTHGVELKPSKGTPHKSTRAFLAMTNDRLLIAVHAAEPDMSSLQAPNRRRDDSVWNDDAIDVVISDGNKVLRQWIVSAGGALFDAMQGNPQWDSDVAIAIHHEADAWTAELSILLSDIFDGEAPPTFRMNMARHAPPGGLLTWSPTSHLPDPSTLGLATTLDEAGLGEMLAGTQGKSTDTPRGFVVWGAEPQTQNLGPSSRPPAGHPTLKTVELHSPGRGNDSAVLLVTNFDHESVTFRVNHPRLIDGPDERTVAFNEIFTLYRGVARLNSYQIVTFDPLEKMGDARTFVVPGGETAMIFLDAHPPAGLAEYRTELTFVPTTVLPQNPVDQKDFYAGKPAPTGPAVKIALHAGPVDLPNPLPVNTYAFGPYCHLLVAKGLEKEYVQMAREFGITWTMSAYPLGQALGDGPTISSNPEHYLSARMLAAKDHIVFSYNLLSDFDSVIRRRGFSGQLLDTQWKDLFARWMNNWMSAVSDARITPEDFIIEIEDEPKSEQFPHVVEFAAFVKHLAPQVRTAVTVGSANTLEQVEALAPYIDLWIVSEPRLTRRKTSAQEHAFYRREGQYWPYRCSLRMDVQPLLSYYRYRGINNWLLGSDGYALWTLNGWLGDPWMQWDVINKSGQARFDEGMIYNGVTGPVPSIRLMAFRQGVQDFALLEMLRARRGFNDRQQLHQSIRHTPLDPEELLKSTRPGDIRRWRQELLKALANRNH